ncbi:MAG: SU10 major capsid protein [Bacteroidales bacterium]
MTVLKSFDLKGNKQSFAGWISNLSPCDTPFVSMIGKEGVSQTQYSWQMDALAKPKYDGFEEGSIVESEKREPTHVTHNFTQTLRKVTHISDTIASLSTYGRSSEMEYQMGKAGKELKRDMEFMCLNNGVGNIGTGTLASKFSGFLPLCAPKDYVDLSTGAKTFKEVTVSDLEGPWFKATDLFDLTYNLYLAGSKANKIMFHPHHATTFSDFMGQSVETAHTYRMFDGVSTKYNAQVSKIRDPLAQVFDLIPNRHMPKDKIYIFNEADWTQMILRQPVVSKLGKQGSSERFLLETEIGLRHRHINASGVMSMTPSTLLIEWEQKPNPLTSGINQTEEASVLIKDRATGNLVPDTTTFVWTSSNPLVVSIADPTGQTADGKANTLLRPEGPGTSVITVSSQDGFASYVVTVRDPSLHLKMSNYIVEKRKMVLAIAYATDASGKVLPDGTMVSFKALPGDLVQMNSISAPTTDGTANVEVVARDSLGLVQLQANIGEIKSNFVKLEIVEKVEQLAFKMSRQVIAHGANDSAEMEVSVTDADGVGIVNKTVEIGSSDRNVIQPTVANLVTDAQGIAKLRVTAKALGSTRLIASFGKQNLEYTVVVSAPDIVLGCPESATTDAEFQMSALVTRSDDSLIEGVDVLFEADPPFNPVIPEAATGADGTARVRHSEANNSEFEVKAKIGAYESNMCKLAVNLP